MRVRLHISVATIFTLFTSALLAIIVAFFYHGNKHLALLTAEEQMEAARSRSVANMLDIVLGAEDVIADASVFIANFPKQALSLRGLDVLQSKIEGEDHYYGLFFGVESSGEFFQNINSPRDLQILGSEANPVPNGTEQISRIISIDESERMETYFRSQKGKTPNVLLRQPTEFDPRTRPWYLGARDAEGIFITPLYRFESTGRLGVTFSQKVLNQNGRLMGVVGLDMTMSALLNILNDMRIGEEGIAFILDSNERILSYTGTRSEGRAARFVGPDSDETIEADLEVINAAIGHWQSLRTPFFRLKPSGESRQYVASIAPILDIFGAKLTLGVTAAEDDFVGGIKRTTQRAIAVGGIAFVLSLLGTVLFSRLLSKSLRRVAEDARRMSNFELGEDQAPKSKIQEVYDLESAMVKMKAGISGFGAYVPKELVRSIISKAQKISVGGTSGEITVMFTDLQKFTSLTESLSPEILMPALSEYFEIMERQISDHMGTVDKYMGDAIMALWNAPVNDEQHAIHACNAALACLNAEASLNSSSSSSPLRPLRTRFGIHSGSVAIGNIGSLSRLQYTALGATVNFASRLEGLNKFYGTRILVSDAVAHEVKDEFLLREIDTVIPVGTTQPTLIFELIGALDAQVSDSAIALKKRVIADWQACYELYKSGRWQEALDAFKVHRNKSDNQVLVDLFIERCGILISNPPERNWDGIFRFIQK